MAELRSRILVGQVMHRRSEPVVNEFCYPLYYYIFDLDELAEISKRVPLFGHNKISMVSLHEKDYLRGEGTLREKVLSCLQREGYNDPIGRIELVTAARYFNYVFNPASFYYCYSSSTPRADTPLYIITEINNTYGERHIYISKNPELTPATEPSQFALRDTQAKSFFVSPFYNVDGSYQFAFSPLAKKVEIRIDVSWKDKRPFKARMWGETLPLTTSNLVKTLLKYPLTAALTMPRILWQAVKLHYIKGLPVMDKPFPSSSLTIGVPPPTMLERLAMRLVFANYEKIRGAHITAVLPSGEVREVGTPGAKERAEIQILSYRFFTRLVSGGGIGLGESFQAGEWKTKDLPGFLRLILNQFNTTSDRALPFLNLLQLPSKVSHWLRRNTLIGSRKNISAHYNLSNEMFSLFLDPSMTYSSGVYSKPTDTLAQAQENKIRMLLAKLDLSSADHLLEIGSGWGALAITAAKTFGCKVTTLTLSEEQLKCVVSKAAAEGVSHLVSARLCDYRQLNSATDKFTKIVSVEMLEAVGHEYLEAFFAACDRVLLPGGIATVQVITYPDHDYKEYLKRTDWIQKHIFPGSHLPSLTALLEAVSKSSQFWVESVESIGPHYATTLRDWRENFLAASSEVTKLGFDARFCRTWEFYLASCEAEFATKWLNVLQIVFVRPNERTSSQGKQSAQVVHGSFGQSEVGRNENKLRRVI